MIAIAKPPRPKWEKHLDRLEKGLDLIPRPVLALFAIPLYCLGWLYEKVTGHPTPF